MPIKCPKCQTGNPSDSKFCKECATPLPFPVDLSVTKTLETPKEELSRGKVFAGRYEIIEELGKGGMGTVYRAEDTKIKQEIALKLIRPEIASDKRTIDRFSNEIKTARMVSHRNVCRMFDLGEEDGTHFITMEYVPGEDLKSLIKRVKRLDAGTAMNIAVQACEGLAEAHRLGVVHRDLKSSNIMIDRDGNVRIMDFGIARSVSSKGLTGEGIIIGTPEYMSPEQADAKDVDRRSDLYSLGVILYEMVTGSLPFEGETPLGTVLKHKSEAPPAPKKLNPQIPDDLNLLILKCLTKDREERFQTAEALEGELERIAQTMPTAERESPKRRPLTSKEITITLGVKKLLFPAVVVLAVAVIAVFLWRPWTKEKPVSVLSDRPSLAILRFTNNTGDASLDHWRDGLLDLLVTDISQSKHVYVVGSEQIYGVLERFGLHDKEKYSSDDLKKVAAEIGVGHVLTGSYLTAGDQFIINIALQNPYTSEAIERIKADGIGVASIQESIDKITLQVKSALNLSENQIADDYDKRVADITTSSPEALQYYNQAQRLRSRGEAKQALELLEKAVELDPDFAMAYRAIWMIYDGLGDAEKKVEAREKVKELKERLPRREKLLIEQNLLGGSLGKRYEMLKEILKDYPEDAVANGHFGAIGTQIEEWDECIAQLEKFLSSVKYEDSWIFLYLSHAYRAKGLYDKAEELLKSYQENVEDIGPVRLSLALTYACQAKYDLALFQIEDDDFFEAKGNIHFLSGEFEEAEIEYEKMIASENRLVQIRGQWRLGNLYIARGMYERVKKEAEESIAKGGGDTPRFNQVYVDMATGRIQEGLDKFDELWNDRKDVDWLRPSLLWWRGIFSLKADLIDEAQKALADFKALIEESESTDWGPFKRDTLYLQAGIELKRGNFPDAIAFLKEAISFLHQQHSWSYEGSGISLRRHTDPQCMYMSLLGLAYYQNGDWENARDAYEKLTRLTTGRLRDGDKYAKAFYMLGKVYEKLDWPGKAIENYERFLELWRDADPGLAEVDDARKRLVTLK